MIRIAIAALFIAVGVPCRAEMITAHWPSNLLAAKRAELAQADKALAAARGKSPPNMEEIKNAERAVARVGVLYHFSVVPPSDEAISLPDFEAKALAVQGFSTDVDVSHLDVRSALQKASYDELVAFLVARGIGRKLFKWAGRSGGQFSVSVTRQMALAAFDKEPE